MKTVFTAIIALLFASSIHAQGYNTVHGHVYDCLGAPVVGHPVYVSVDSTSSPISYYNTVYTDVFGLYQDTVPFGFFGPPQVIYVGTLDPAPGTGYYYMNHTASTAGNVFVSDFNTACAGTGSCGASFISYQDSTGANDTLYLVLNYTSSSPSSTTVTWDYGDGTFGSGPYTTHTYSSIGTYNVCVTVFDASDSCTATYCNVINYVYRAGFIMKTVPAVPTVIQEKNEIASVTVFPNPVENILTISTEDLIKVKSITVYDVTGRSQFTLNNTSVTNTLHMDTHTLTPGAYKMVLFDEFQNPLYTHTLLKH